jgi:hypothetical protein
MDKMIELFIIKTEYRDSEFKNDIQYRIPTNFIPREGDLLVIDDAMDGPDASISMNVRVNKVEYFYKMNQTYHDHNELSHVNIYI